MYIEADKQYINDGLRFGGSSYMNGSVDLCILREMTDALAVIHNKYRVQANENLGELIQSVTKHIINSANYNEYAMPPKVSTYEHVVSYRSLRD